MYELAGLGVERRFARSSTTAGLACLLQAVTKPSPMPARAIQLRALEVRGSVRVA